MSAYKRNGLDGLTPKPRSDKGKHRSTAPEVTELIQGLYLRTPPVPVSAISRRVCEVCKRNGWRVPSYDVIHQVISEIPPQLKTLAHEGINAYKHLYGLSHRFEADRPNEIWQADHTNLDILILDSRQQQARPWLTVVIDD